MNTVLPSPHARHPTILLIILLLTVIVSPIKAHDEGLWGSIKGSIEPITQPIQESVCSKYNKLSDKGRFVTGACVGFGATRLAIGTTMKTIKTMGAAYIAFEALEYAGLLKEARSSKNRQLLAQSRDYCLRTVDGVRHDIRTQLNPQKIQDRLKSSMKKDKPGTVGFGTGAFLGFAL